MNNLTKKEKDLFEYIVNLTKKRVIVAFSGGVDSSLVLKIAREVSSKEDVLAVTYDTILHPKNDIEIVKNLVEEFDVNLSIIRINEIEDERILNNDVKRCYYCKKNIFEKAIELKNSLNFGYILDGSNFDDINSYRPGRLALKELGVISPLEDIKFTKNEVRILAEKLNITVFNRPSKPCMMTRMTYDKKVDISKFDMLEKSEEYLSSLGFTNNRVRLYDDVTRIEIEIDKFDLFFKNRQKIVDKFKELGFLYVNLDMEGFRSGSMDLIIDKENRDE